VDRLIKAVRAFGERVRVTFEPIADDPAPLRLPLVVSGYEIKPSAGKHTVQVGPTLSGPWSASKLADAAVSAVKVNVKLNADTAETKVKAKDRASSKARVK
jgi:hypothetical protein